MGFGLIGAGLTAAFLPSAVESFTTMSDKYGWSDWGGKKAFARNEAIGNAFGTDATGVAAEAAMNRSMAMLLDKLPAGGPNYRPREIGVDLDMMELMGRHQAKLGQISERMMERPPSLLDIAASMGIGIGGGA